MEIINQLKDTYGSPFPYKPKKSGFGKILNIVRGALVHEVV